MPAGTIHLEWRTVYIWLRRHARISMWAARAAEFLEIASSKLIDSGQFAEGTLTTFAGFPFGHDRPFTYLEGAESGATRTPIPGEGGQQSGDCGQQVIAG